MRFLNYENLWGFFGNQTIFDDVISGWKWQWITTSFGVTQDIGLNFYMKQSELDFRSLEALWISSIEAMFWILRLKKIDQNGLESDTQKLFYTNSSTQNSMSCFSIKRSLNFRKTKVESHHCNHNISVYYEIWLHCCAWNRDF